MIGCMRKYLYVTPSVLRLTIPGARAGIRTRVSGMKPAMMDLATPHEPMTSRVTSYS